MELTDKEIHLLARLSRDRGLYAECKGTDLDALRKLGLLQWSDARLSTTPFAEDPRPLFRLLLFSGRIDYFWVEPVENWRELVGPEVSARVDAIDDFQTVKLSSRVMETEDPHTPKSIGRHHATSAPVPAACQ